MSDHAVRSLGRSKLGRRTIYLLPLAGMGYGAISLLIVGVLLLFIDRVVLGSLERGGWTAGELWKRHNRLVEENHRRKITKDDFALRDWDGEKASRGSPASRKILVIGDSFVWGPPYPTLNHLWWRQLALELERRGYRDVDVVAAGHSGWSTRQELECAQRLLPQVRPDIVVWGYVTNDPDELIVAQIFYLQDKSPIPNRIRARLKWLYPNLLFKFESLRADKLAVQYAGPRYGYAYPDWELKLLEGENFRRYRDTVAATAAELRKSSPASLLLTLPSLPCREYFKPRYEPVLPLWRQAGVPVRDTLDDFVQRYGNAPAVGPEALRWGINPADSHPGPRAAHFHAVMAADYLEQHHAELLGPKNVTQPHVLAINDWLPFDLNVRPQGAGEFLLDYPATTELMPVLPLDVPTALVALRYPLPVNEIRLEGAGLRGGRTWVSTLHPTEHYDECQWRELPRQSGGQLSFRLPADLAGRALATVRFAADVAGTNRELKLTLVPAAEVLP